MNNETREEMKRWIKTWSAAEGNLKIGLNLIMKGMIENEVRISKQRRKK